MKLSNAILLVTGANRGLGRALTLAALAGGARRVYATARDPHQLADLVAGAPDRVVPLALDVTNAHSLAAAAERAPDVTMLVNNAGVLASHRVTTSPLDQIELDFAVNATGLLAASRAFLPALERAAAAGPAAVVNVLSIASLANLPALGGYSAAKAAAYSLTQALRADLAPKHIRVHAVLPGTIDTDMVRDLPPPKTSPAAVAAELFAAVEQDRDEIFPDPISRELHAMWQRDPAALVQQFLAMSA